MTFNNNNNIITQNLYTALYNLYGDCSKALNKHYKVNLYLLLEDRKGFTPRDSDSDLGDKEQQVPPNAEGQSHLVFYKHTPYFDLNTTSNQAGSSRLALYVV